MSESPIQVSDEKTKAGNYFVANYPPFSFWQPELVETALDVLDQPPRSSVPMGVYLHIPFCRKRCHFCYFKVYTDRNAEQIQSYIDALLKELSLYTSRAAIQGRKPRFIYFGGGTPSYLSNRQLRRLFEGLREQLDWSEVEEVTFECEPGTLSGDKLTVLRELGVTRLSLGVESFDDQLLELGNRAHRSAQIFEAWDNARKEGFPQINIDLIAGMLGETDANWTRSVEETIRLGPESVTIYQMEIPFNTQIYRDMRAAGQDIAPVADWPCKRRWVAEAYTRLEAAGYEINSTTTAIKKSESETRFLYRSALWHGADLVPLGVASFGHIQGVHLQNQHDSTSYESRVMSGVLPIYRAYSLEPKEALVREFILQLKLGHLRFKPFLDKFSLDPRREFAAPLAALKARGIISKMNDDSLTLSREGLIIIDSVLSEFFLEEHQNARYT